MKPETLEIYGYKKIDDVIRRIEAWLATGSNEMLGYSAAASSKRLAQKIVAVLTVSFLQEGIRQYAGGKEHFPSDDGKFACAGLKIDARTGIATPDAKLLFRSMTAFVLLWLAVFGAWLLALATGKRFLPCVLLTGVPADDLSFRGNDQRFVRFCRNGTLPVLKGAKWLVVQAINRVNATCPEEIWYVRFPLLTVFASCKHGTARSFFFLKQHLAALFAYFHGVWLRPVNCLLWRDLAEHSAAATLSEGGLIDAVVITNSNWLQQLLWMSDLRNRRFKLYMALYSLNSSTIVYKDDPVSYGHPGIRHLRVDEIWIWNEAYRTVLARERVSPECRAVGPILWYLPENQRPSGIGREPTLCVFDVTPRSSEGSVAASGSYLNYYNVQNAIKFIDDILYARDKAAARLGVGIKIMLKHKRPPTRVHDARYFEHLDRVVSADASVTMASSDSNVYSLIADSILVIVPPCSSPAYVAGFLKVPAIFYDSSGNVLPTCAQDPMISFIDDREHLCDAVLRATDRALSKNELPS